jgi:hypothetical protein
MGGSSGTPCPYPATGLYLAQHGPLATLGQTHVSAPSGPVVPTGDRGVLRGGRRDAPRAHARPCRRTVSLLHRALAGRALHQPGCPPAGRPPAGTQRARGDVAPPYAGWRRVVRAVAGGARLLGLCAAGVPATGRGDPRRPPQWRGSGREHAACRHGWRTSHPGQWARRHGHQPVAAHAAGSTQPETVPTQQGFLTLETAATPHAAATGHGASSGARQPAHGHAPASRCLPQRHSLWRRAVQRRGAAAAPASRTDRQPRHHTGADQPPGRHTGRSDHGRRTLHQPDVSVVRVTQQTQAHLSVRLRGDRPTRCGRCAHYPAHRSRRGYQPCPYSPQSGHVSAARSP